MMKTHSVISTGLLIAFIFSAGCKKHRNPVLDYLDGAEIQYEGEVQKENLIDALQDALHLPPEILQGRMYKDYQGSENRWDLPTVIRRHFVPDSKSKTLGSNFYHDITSEKARGKVAEILEKLEAAP
jgi:hypothetical protein